MGDDCDTHICLSCHMAIIGLDNYVQHKKVDCPARRGLCVATPSQTQATLCTGGSQLPTPNMNTIVTNPASLRPHLSISQHGGGGGGMSSFSMGCSQHSTHESCIALSVDLTMPGASAMTNTSQRLPVTTLATSSLTLSPTTGRLVSGLDVMASGASTGASCCPGSLTLSPSAGRIVDPNVVLYSTHDPSVCSAAAAAATSSSTTNIVDFLSTLDLQCRTSPSHSSKTAGPFERDLHGVSGEPKPDSNRANLSFDAFDHQTAKSLFDNPKLRITSMLNDFDFSSDSEGFMPSDADNFLDFSDNEDVVSSQPASSCQGNSPAKWTHTAGKWVPQSSTSDKWSTQPHPSGKWSPLSPTTGKWPPQSNSEDTLLLSPVPHITPSAPVACDMGPKNTQTVQQHSSIGGKYKETLFPSAHAKQKSVPKKAGSVLEEDSAEEQGHEEGLSPTRLKARKVRSIGGKWRPGHAPQCGGARWKSSEMPPSGRGMYSKLAAYEKRQQYSGDEEEIEEEEDEENQSGMKQCQTGNSSGVDFTDQSDPGSFLPCGDKRLEPDATGDTPLGSLGLVDKEGSVQCIPCGRRFTSTKSYKRHLASSLHMKRFSQAQKANEETASKTTPTAIRSERREGFHVECTTCTKEFNNKYNFVRHLNSSYHIRRAKSGEDPFLLDEGCQKLLLHLSPFQCRVCSAYFNDPKQFEQHFSDGKHLLLCQSLVGPLLCVNCKFVCRDFTKMTNHVHGAAHVNQIRDSGKHCIVKESRTRVACKHCSLVLHSVVQLCRHIKAAHPNLSDSCTRKLDYSIGVQEGEVPSALPSKGDPSVLSQVPKTLNDKQCHYCEKVFSSRYNLVVHIRRRHSKERPFTCDTCSVAFADRGTFNLHLKSLKHLNTLVSHSKHKQASRPVKVHQSSVSSSRNPYKCKHCEVSTSEYSELRAHYIEFHAKQMFICDVCGVSFLSLALYEKHLRGVKHRLKSHESSLATEGPHKCPVCGRIFYKATQLMLHQQTRHAISASTGSKHKVKKSKALLQAVEDHYSEFIKTLPKKSTAQVECPDCSKVLRRVNIMPHLRLHLGKLPFLCNYCDSAFASTSALRRHLKVHLDIKTFKCSHCSKEFTRQVYLKTHILRHHPSMQVDAKFACQCCGQRFIQQYQLSLHMQRKHSEKRLKCEHPGCRKLFCYPSELNLHMRTHTDVRPFLCDQCGYAGKAQWHLTRHKRIHSGERNHPCEYCTFTASNPNNLRRHMRIHIGARLFKCPHCDYRGNNFHDLRHHITNTERHRGLSLYNCKFCPFNSNKAIVFREHLYVDHMLSNRDIGQPLSVYAGLYMRELDASKVPEGSQVLPVRERKTRRPDGDKTRRYISPRKKARETGRLNATTSTEAFTPSLAVGKSYEALDLPAFMEDGVIERLTQSGLLSTLCVRSSPRMFGCAQPAVQGSISMGDSLVLPVPHAASVVEVSSTFHQH